ncbi:hypothetical protein [Streptomyces sp900116325]|uniref:hypothetical protein n=1 Tax=Streptomyces sp. 900116325 TaxID=3154295 RepID=UPI0033A6617B
MDPGTQPGGVHGSVEQGARGLGARFIAVHQLGCPGEELSHAPITRTVRPQGAEDEHRPALCTGEQTVQRGADRLATAVGVEVALGLVKPYDRARTDVFQVGGRGVGTCGLERMP